MRGGSKAVRISSENSSDLVVLPFPKGELFYHQKSMKSNLQHWKIFTCRSRFSQYDFLVANMTFWYPIWQQYGVLTLLLLMHCGFLKSVWLHAFCIAFEWKKQYLASLKYFFIINAFNRLGHNLSLFVSESSMDYFAFSLCLRHYESFTTPIFYGFINVPYLKIFETLRKFYDTNILGVY